MVTCPTYARSSLSQLNEEEAVAGLRASGQDRVAEMVSAMNLVMTHIGGLDFAYAGLAARPQGRLVRFMAK